MINKPRARDLGIPLDGMPGAFNAITDVKGVRVGHTTLIAGEGKLEIGNGPVRTGVTAIITCDNVIGPLFGAWNTLNGCGEITGSTWLEESGFLFGPLLITNTMSINMVKDAVTKWLHQKFSFGWGLSVVTETYDGFLNDIYGFHVKEEHAWSALDNATSGAVLEGNVGGGTGMICHQFKGGIGTSSRIVNENAGTYTIGVLVQANYGDRKNLRVAGIPVGIEIPDRLPGNYPNIEDHKNSSIIVVIATDCPLLPHQLKRLCKRAPLGNSRMGGNGDNWSGDIFIAFSTAPFGEADRSGVRKVQMYPNEKMDALFEAVIQAAEEAILNALIAAETMTGVDDHTVFALPHDHLQRMLRKYNRLALP
jgi:D-aminopeptidase